MDPTPESRGYGYSARHAVDPCRGGGTTRQAHCVVSRIRHGRVASHHQGATRLWGKCTGTGHRVMPSSWHRSPTLVSGCPMAVIARRNLARKRVCAVLHLSQCDLNCSRAPQWRPSRCRHKQNYILATIFLTNMPDRPLSCCSSLPELGLTRPARRPASAGK